MRNVDYHGQSWTVKNRRDTTCYLRILSDLDSRGQSNTIAKSRHVTRISDDLLMTLLAVFRVSVVTKYLLSNWLHYPAHCARSTVSRSAKKMLPGGST